jgi:hypothetical protein
MPFTIRDVAKVASAAGISVSVVRQAPICGVRQRSYSTGRLWPKRPRKHRPVVTMKQPLAELSIGITAGVRRLVELPCALDHNSMNRPRQTTAGKVDVIK